LQWCNIKVITAASGSPGLRCLVFGGGSRDNRAIFVLELTDLGLELAYRLGHRHRLALALWLWLSLWLWLWLTLTLTLTFLRLNLEVVNTLSRLLLLGLGLLGLSRRLWLLGSRARGREDRSFITGINEISRVSGIKATRHGEGIDVNITLALRRSGLIVLIAFVVQMLEDLLGNRGLVTASRGNFSILREGLGLIEEHFILVCDVLESWLIFDCLRADVFNFTFNITAGLLAR
jgi:hypothetical protein